MFAPVLMLRRLCKSNRGVAYIEFAMALPILLMASLTGIEVANLVMSHLRVSNISMMTADNASRVRDSIDESDVVELFVGARTSGSSIGFTEHGRIILSSLETSDDGTKQWIRWQRCIGQKNVNSSDGRPMSKAGTAIIDGTEVLAENRTNQSAAPSHWEKQTITGMGPADRQIQAPGGSAVMVAEVVYDYQPVFFDNWLGDTEIKSIMAFNVRQRANQLIRNGGKIQPYSCNRFTQV
ncbi:TadE/TadG family type IV pilus assembly protein [Allosphingosinicella vermicomposti]|uniref:TadE/TadG family type IV pilus assembly protein n=1 Tax=Allosphingosinicella vermicomposti TaxID=614671 RepID=UPI001FE1CC1B|nr:TadE/TadG family type IV pilus assembly protein [Allosphingosinicella vermicomposti]